MIITRKHLASAFVSFGFALALLGTAPQKAEASACIATSTHWGKTAHTKWRARKNARAGMDWKIRKILGGYGRVYRGVRIVRCKVRQYGQWQCKASVKYNACSGW